MRFKVISLFFVSALVFLSTINSSHETSLGLGIGDKAPILDSELLNGVEFNPESLKGKMVLIDFWASYDAPSRVDNFHKKMILDKYRKKSFYKSEGLVVVSISLDRFKAPYLRSIERDGLKEFMHICDFEGENSKWAEAFAIDGEMMTYLVDGEGRIVEKSSDLDKIDAALKRLDSAQIEGLAFGVLP
ncbi:MAG TPA: TlpA disulfide reductase family protein [Marinilabiliaceae bacterium]|nr:TlpA disulfide reductase family protein [Marinilabiliaceae bacterium]